MKYLLTLSILALLIASAFSSFALAEESAPNLLKAADFKVTDGKVVGWRDYTKPAQKYSVDANAGAANNASALRIDIEKDGGKSHGQLVQTVKVEPNTTYKISADLKGTDEGIAYVQVKLLEGKKEGTRISTGTNKSIEKWESLSKEFTTETNTDNVAVVLRFRMNAGYVGKTAWYSNVTLTKVAPAEKKAE